MANDPASLAVAAQIRDNRYKADVWLNVTLPPMMKLWKGVGGAKFSDFFVSEEDARESMGRYVGTEPYKFAATLWRFAQVEPHPERGYRGKIMEFVVDLPTAAAVGICRANPSLGSGSIFQYFIPSWDQTLRPTRRTYRFEEKDYPKL